MHAGMVAGLIFCTVSGSVHIARLSQLDSTNLLALSLSERERG